MQYTVFVRIDAAGECPVLVHDGEELPGSDGAPWRLIGETNDYGEAVGWLEAEHARCYRSPRTSAALVRSA
jgi:hypothetical protein